MFYLGAIATIRKHGSCAHSVLIFSTGKVLSRCAHPWCVLPFCSPAVLQIKFNLQLLGLCHWGSLPLLFAMTKVLTRGIHIIMGGSGIAEVSYTGVLV